MDFNVASISEKGEREKNEDCIVVSAAENSLCAVLCDGLGGHYGGELASACVCESIKKNFECHDWEGSPEELVNSLIEQAQEDLHVRQLELGREDGIKTTVCCLVIKDDKAAAAYVGDSRIYLFKNNKMFCRTQDHSVPQYLVKMGEIKETDIRHHPDRNKLLRVMGSKWDQPQQQQMKLPELDGRNDFLICSDGFWEWITEKEMTACLREADTSQAWLDKMRDLVNEHGAGNHMDNFSAIAVRVVNKNKIIKFGKFFRR